MKYVYKWRSIAWRKNKPLIGDNILLFLLYFWVLTVYVDHDTNQFSAISRKSPIVIVYLANLN